MVDFSNPGFWYWIQKYSPMFGVKALFQVLDYEPSPELLNSELEVFLPILKTLFDQKILYN
jgi:ABC-type polysaccharide transport system permease subunit